MKKPGIKHLSCMNLLLFRPFISVGWMLALVLLGASLAGCSVQKRTTTRGFHIEHKATQLRLPVVAETQGLATCGSAPKFNTHEKLERLSGGPIKPSEAKKALGRSILPNGSAPTCPDAGARQTENPRPRRAKLKNPVLSLLSRPTTLDTTSQETQVAHDQLEELRTEARRTIGWNFLLGLALIPLGIILGEDYLLYQGIGLLVLGLYIKRLTNNDAGLLAWKEKRLLKQQRRQNRTWWQWLLRGLAFTSVFALATLAMAFAIGLVVL